MQISLNHNFKFFLDCPKSYIKTNTSLKDSDEYQEIYSVVSGEIIDELKVLPHHFKGKYHFNMLDNELFITYSSINNENLKMCFKFDLYRELGRFADIPLAINCIEYDKIFSKEEKGIPHTYDDPLPLMKFKLLNISIQGDENNYLFYLDVLKELMSTILKTEYNEAVKNQILRTTTIDKKIISECNSDDKITELIFNNDNYIIDSVLFNRYKV